MRGSSARQRGSDDLAAGDPPNTGRAAGHVRDDAEPVPLGERMRGSGQPVGDRVADGDLDAVRIHAERQQPWSQPSGGAVPSGQRPPTRRQRRGRCAAAVDDPGPSCQAGWAARLRVAVVTIDGHHTAQRGPGPVPGAGPTLRRPSRAAGGSSVRTARADRVRPRAGAGPRTPRHTGRPRRSLGAVVGPGYVKVAHDKALVRKGPAIDTDDVLPTEDEQAVFAHFGLSYRPGTAGERQLARR